MRYAELLTHRADIRLLLQDFDAEFQQIVNLHRFTVAVVLRDFTAAYDDFMERGDPESYDGAMVFGTPSRN